MREIKFRAFALKIVNGRVTSKRTNWIYGYYSEDCGASSIIEKSGNEIDVDRETVGQYTGIKDARGKEIYEGDIISFWDGYLKKVRHERVYFESGAFWVNGRAGQQEWDRVIGNIYENPELLKEK